MRWWTLNASHPQSQCLFISLRFHRLSELSFCLQCKHLILSCAVEVKASLGHVCMSPLDPPFCTLRLGTGPRLGFTHCSGNPEQLSSDARRQCIHLTSSDDEKHCQSSSVLCSVWRERPYDRSAVVYVRIFTWLWYDAAINVVLNASSHFLMSLPIQRPNKATHNSITVHLWTESFRTCRRYLREILAEESSDVKTEGDGFECCVPSHITTPATHRWPQIMLFGF